MRAVDTLPGDALRATHEAAVAADHAADLKARGFSDDGQTPIAIAAATLAVACELAELRAFLERAWPGYSVTGP